ncbi:TonB-dependent receptor domain-containing protein [Novilysobacter avium]|uniref:TonB-dependent receptor n=1 Tax=Novilysobacter avium TaxID=2781023 RepID=A0A7S6UK98_9GAMM|nr:TonB-dependent receptor [Lysobacter avium]QOW21796.1 TonB-dependent receptor [Lysobacter avium]
MNYAPKRTILSVMLASAMLMEPVTALAQDAAQPAQATQTDATPIATDDAAPPAVQTADAKAKDLDRVVVVGSHLAGNNDTGMLPVFVVSEEDVAATGAVSGEDLLQSLPQVGDMMFDNTDTAGNLNAARGDVGSVNLRNLGTGNTLMLVNGRRMVNHPGTQTETYVPRQTANINAIPLYGVQRMETLLGGASALYGSDAVAGVMNVVMDTHFQGLRAQAQYGGSEGTDFRQGNFNVKAGRWFNDGRTRVSLLGGYTYRSIFENSERDYAASQDHRPFFEGTQWEGMTAFDDRMTSSAWGAFQTVDRVRVRQDGKAITTAAGSFHIEPIANGCVTALYEDVCIQTGLQNSTIDRPLRFNANSQRYLMGGVDRGNLFTTIEHDLNDDFVAFGEVSYYQSSYDGMREQAASLAAAPMIVPKSNYWNPFGATYLPDGSLNPNRLQGIDAPEEGLDVRISSYRATETTRPYEVDDKSYRVLGGVRGDLGGFDWESAVLYSRARTVDTQFGTISNTSFAEALARADESAYNPFTGGNLDDWSQPPAMTNADTVAGFLVPVVRRSTASLFQVDTRFARPDLFEWWAGDVGLAFGAEWRHEKLDDQRDPRLNGQIGYTNPLTDLPTSDVLGASPSGNNGGSRSVASAYAEIAVPLVSREMAIPLVRSLDLQIAGRYERYSDFGSVSKPKVAFAWDILDGLMMRGSWSESFLAPNILQIHSDGTVVSNTRLDYYQCEADLRAGRISSFSACGKSFSTQAVREGNLDLKPETSEATSVGLVFQPRFLPDAMGDFTFTADYWKIDQEQMIAITGEQTHLALDYLMRIQGSSNPNVLRDDPSDEQIANFAGTGLEAVGNVLQVRDQYTNRLPRRTRGIDYGISHRLRTADWGTFTTNLNGSRLLEQMQMPSDLEDLVMNAQQDGVINDGFTIRNAGSLLGINGTPEWRATLSSSWRYRNWSLGAFVRYVGPFDSTGASLPDGTLFRVPSWTTTNLWAEHRFKKTGNVFEDTTVRFNVRNITDRDPRLAPRSLGFYSGLHNALGRGYYLTVTKTFD